MSKQTELAQVADTITVDSGNVGIGTTAPTSYAKNTGIAIRGGNQAGVETYAGQDASDTTAFLNMYADQNQNYQRFFDVGAVGASGGQGSNMRFLTQPNGGTPRVHMQIDRSGRVTKPYQPAFVANTSPSTLTNNVDIVWSATSLNRGSVYNTSNGRFTAPVAGLYQFFASVRIETAVSVVSYHRISFKHNGSFVQSSRSQLNHRTATGYYSHSANDQAIYLNLNDYVNVTFETGGGSSSFSTSAFGEHVFYGYLIG